MGLQQRIDSPCIYKTFDYTIEDLQDNPECLNKIVEYLDLHSDKYEDFDIHFLVQPETFTPSIVIQLYLKGLHRHVDSNRIKQIIKHFQNTQ